MPGSFPERIHDFGGLEKEQKKAIRKGLKVMCRECQMGVAAAQLALADAALKLGMLDPDRTGIPSAPTTCSRCPRRLPKALSSASTGKAGSDFSRWGGSGMDQDVAPVAAEVSAEHAGQPFRDLQRLPRP